jgi:hypothetical protein
MIVKPHSQRLQSLDEIRALLEVSIALGFEVPARDEAYGWIETSLRQLDYLRLGKADRGLVKAYLEETSGFSPAQMTRLITQYRRSGRVRDHRGRPANAFVGRYTPQDVALLAEVDTLHGTLSGLATRKLCERVLEVFGERRKPFPEGRPGFLRVDTVHQGDFDGIKGLYHLNAVDAFTQMQVIASVKKISKRYLPPALYNSCTPSPS